MHSKLGKILIAIIILGAFAVRLYKFDSPVADWHSWRQADTSAVTRNFVKFGLDLMHPRFDDLSNIPSGYDNPQGYRFVEFPLYNFVSYLIYNFPLLKLNIEQSGRFVSILASLFSIYLLYKIVRHFWGGKLGLLSAFFFAFLPYNIYYSRTILPDTAMVALSLAAIFTFIEFAKNRNAVYLLLFVFFSASSLLVKPTAFFMLLPVLHMFITQFRLSKKNIFLAAFCLALAVLPLFFWRKWINQYPEGIPVWMWLLNGDGIRFKGAFFYWLFAERLSKLILGYWGIALLVLGFLSKEKKNLTFFALWFFSMILYLFIFATGNVKHDYYQIPLLPVICVFAGLGVEFLLSQKKIAFFVLTLIVVFFSFAFSWHQIRTYYWINNSNIVEIGKIADEILPKEAKVIASYGGDTAFLYQTNRQGWPIGFEIEDKIKKGADYYISYDIHDWETTELLKKYEAFYTSGNYAIIKLQ